MWGPGTERKDTEQSAMHTSGQREWPVPRSWEESLLDARRRQKEILKMYFFSGWNEAKPFHLLISKCQKWKCKATFPSWALLTGYGPCVWLEPKHLHWLSNVILADTRWQRGCVYPLETKNWGSFFTLAWVTSVKGGLEAWTLIPKANVDSCSKSLNWGTWVAQSVKCLIFDFHSGRVVISRFMSLSPASGFALTERSLFGVFSLSLSLSLCASLSLSLFLSLKINKH